VVFWSVVITLVTIGLLFAGNFEAMQTMVVLAGLPFSVVLVLFMFGLHKAMKQDVQIEQERAELAARGRRGFSERLTSWTCSRPRPWCSASWTSRSARR
jgi:choline/glycine/proline betaine transport protein